MQDEHPDRLKSPLERVEGLGFVPVGWDAALDRVVSEIKRIQETCGKDSLAILTGASLTNEKAVSLPSVPGTATLQKKNAQR
jgi:assimilatory nitrate reductase catalytic subunit